MGTSAAVDTAGLLEDMLGIPSPTGDTDAMVAWLRAHLQQLGFAATVEHGNVMGVWGLSEAETEIMLVGHLDTVPGVIPVRREGQFLHGRGAVDAKGPLAAAIGAVMDQDPHGGARFVIVAVPDEEGPSRGARRLLDLPAPDHLIVLEPSGWDAVTVGYRGAATVALHLEQPLSHRAGPDPSAPDRLLTAISRVRDHVSQQTWSDSVFSRCDVTVINLESACDGITDSASAVLQFRLPMGLTVERLMADLDLLWTDVSVAVSAAVDGVHTSRTSGVARGLARAIASLGGHPRYKVKSGTADINVLAPHWRCPAVAYGPGDSRLDHTPRECIDVDELERGTRVLSNCLSRLAVRAEGSRP